MLCRQNVIHKLIDAAPEFAQKTIVHRVPPVLVPHLHYVLESHDSGRMVRGQQLRHHACVVHVQAALGFPLHGLVRALCNYNVSKYELMFGREINQDLSDLLITLGQGRIECKKTVISETFCFVLAFGPILLLLLLFGPITLRSL